VATPGRLLDHLQNTKGFVFRNLACLVRRVCVCVSAPRVGRGVAWRGVAWRGVAWRGVARRGVAWRGEPVRGARTSSAAPRGVR
jgi:hypothetical protein